MFIQYNYIVRTVTKVLEIFLSYQQIIFEHLSSVLPKDNQLSVNYTSGVERYTNTSKVIMPFGFRKYTIKIRKNESQ
jgi:hypothetical protein